MSVDFMALRPMRVLVDRSRDICNGWSMVTLAPASIFRTTDNRKPLSEALLKGYDLLVVAAVSRAGYSRGELDAIEAFVRRGGTLLLASSAGQFTVATREADAAHLAQNAVAARFGYAFLPPDGLAMDQTQVRGFEREELLFTPAGAALKLLVGDLPFNRPGMLSVPKGAQVLLVGGKDKRPVIAWSGHGKGKVLVCHDTAMFSDRTGFIASYLINLVDPKERQQAKELPMALIEHATTTRRYGKIVLEMTPPTQRHEKRVLAIARRLLPVLTKCVPPAKPIKEWKIGLETGCGGWGGWNWGDAAYTESHVGVDQSDASLTAALASRLVERLLWSRFNWEIRTMVRSMMPYVLGSIMRQMGHAEYADAALVAIQQHPSFSDKLDFSRIYSEVDTPAALKGLWFDLAEQFGPRFLARIIKLLPEKDVYKHIDWRLYCELDLVAFFLAHIVGKRIYRFLRDRGHSVREIPLEKPASEKLSKALGRALEKLVMSAQEPLSDRYDAACILADRLGERLKEEDKVAAQLDASRPTTRIAAALRLAQRRDARAAEPLRKLVKDHDAGVRAIASLALISECSDRGAADALLAAAHKADTRFQLAAGYALMQAGDRRGKQYTFPSHPACSVKVIGKGQIRANPCADGYEVCNVYSTPMIRPVQYGGGFSTYYVDWVHTSSRWRRRGIARVGMEAGLDWHWDHDCATTSLHTGTRNVAHALYRDFGLADYYRGARFEKALRKEALVEPPKGVKVRPAGRAEKIELMAFANQQLSIRADHVLEVGGWPEQRIAVCARQGSKIVGFAAATPSRDGKSASLECLAVCEPEAPKSKKKRKKKDEKRPGNPYSPREQVGQALLSRLHAELLRKGVKSINLNYWRPLGEQDTPWLLRRAGYGTQLAGGVELYRINHLEQFLREALPGFQGRLDKAKGWSKWSGRITLRGGTQSASLVLERGKVSVAPAKRRSAASEVTISGPLPAIQRLVMGVTSAFDEYYQIEAQIEPMLNEPMTQMLDALFPRMVMET